MRTLPFLFVLLLMLVLPGCEAIAAIFQAGMWVGLLGAILVIGIIVFVVSKARQEPG